MAIPLSKTLSCVLIVIGFMMSAGICSAQLTGTAELSYITYNAKDNEQEIKATSLLQRYSLLYRTSGVLVDNRLGRYKVALGYEWAGLDANIKQIKDDETDQKSMRPKQAGHLLYEGEIVMDPKELPFRFRAYSRDLRETTFQNDTAEFLRGGDPVITPEMPTNIIGGVHMLSGATLVLGVKNGMTNGYNTVFKDIPMLLFDYRDEIHRDRDSQTPTDSRLKKLAFVSLNKKDNWFHYRTTLFTDKINTDSSYKETQIQIGTIDQHLVRRWIDMTNWIKISVDGQFTKRNDYTTSGNEELYELNLFGIASRRLWEAKMYNYFGRKVDDNGPLYERRIPVYARGNVGLDTEWNLRTSYEDWQRSNGNNQEDRTTMMASLRVDTLKRAPFTLSNTIQVERHKANATNYLAIEETIETSSTRRFSDKISLYGSYDVRMFVNDTYSQQPDPADPSGAGTIDVPTQEKYVRQALRARAIYRPENRLKTELEVLIDRTDGNPGNVFTQVGDANAKGESFTHGGSSGEYSRYSVTSRTDWEPLPRFKLAAVISEDVLYEKDVPGDYLSVFGISADYTVANLVARAEMRYTLRTGGTAGDGSVLEQSARVQYTHDRSLDAGLSYRLSRVSEATEADREDVTFTQTLNYYLYSSQGMTRRLVEVNQLADYYKNSGEIKKTASISLRYNPTRQLFISARTKYTFLNRAGTSEREAVYSATAGMNFQKLQVALDYSYGRRDGDDKRIDKRLSMNVRKIF